MIVQVGAVSHKGYIGTTGKPMLSHTTTQAVEPPKVIPMKVVCGVCHKTFAEEECGLISTSFGIMLAVCRHCRGNLKSPLEVYQC
jgi:hypothetical protein